MKLEQQVTSLELSKRLKELGVEQESLFYHYYYENEEGDYIEEIMTSKAFYELYATDVIEQYSAFTVAELLERLPKKMGGDYGGILMIAWVNNREWDCGYYDYFHHRNAEQLIGAEVAQFLDKNPANSLTKMLIYLLENKLT